MAPSASAPPSSAPREAELAIVGAGPVGLYAAYYAGFRGLDTIVLETLPIVGGQIATFYPDTPVYDVAGFPAITGRELLERLAAQAGAFPIPIHLGEEVVRVERSGDGFTLVTARTGNDAATRDGASYRVRAILVTAGIGSFSPQRITEPAIAAYEGRGLLYLPPGEDHVRDARVLVLGGSERAIDVAIACTRSAREVTLVHRRDRLPVSDEVRRRLDASSVRFLPFRELVAVAGSPSVERATLLDRRDSSTEELAVEVVLPCFGFHADASALGRFGVRREGDAILVDSRMATDQPGIYAAGDGATYPGKVRVLAADFGEACTAVNNIAAAIVPGAHLFPGYSSHRKGSPRRPR
jgi:thioredoxin reductase (NADPH)